MQRKYTYEKILQGFYSGQWEDLVSVECDSRFMPLDKKEGQEFRNNVKAYRENDPRAYRVIKRRSINK